MHNHISDLPFNIKQAMDSLNKLISMLYDIAAPSSPLSSDIGDIRKASDHVRVMAMSLIKDCTKEKIEILTSQAAVTHALYFVKKEDDDNMLLYVKRHLMNMTMTNPDRTSLCYYHFDLLHRPCHQSLLQHRPEHRQTTW
jgi:hypothetical protein